MLFFLLRRKEVSMATFIMCGKYSLEALKGIKAERTKKSVKLIEKFGGKVNGNVCCAGRAGFGVYFRFSGD